MNSLNLATFSVKLSAIKKTTSKHAIPAMMSYVLTSVIPLSPMYCDICSINLCTPFVGIRPSDKRYLQMEKAIFTKYQTAASNITAL